MPSASWQSPKSAGPRVALAQMFSSMDQQREIEATKSEAESGTGGVDVMVAVSVTVVLWIEVTGTLVVWIEVSMEVYRDPSLICHSISK